VSSAPLKASLLAHADELQQSLVPHVNAFRERQQRDGTIADPTDADVRLLQQIRDIAAGWNERLGTPLLRLALIADVDGWVAAGLDSKPDFARSRDALLPPDDGQPVLFVAPIQTTNSVPPVGKRLEVFFALRKEPDALRGLAKTHPHPKSNCQSLVLLTASDGFARGNCIVFFPENVAAHDKVVEQAYAMFFYSKFRDIHETYAIPGAEAVLTADSMPRSSQSMTPKDCFEARAIWGYLHDSMHYQGLWPFDQHISLKMNWFVGLLEEIKVDAKTVLACAEESIPFGAQQIDMILLERIFRYPQADDATRNFDSGTGVFLYSWLREHGAIAGDPATGRLLVLHRDKAIDALRDYVETVERLEENVHDDESYKAAAKALVRAYLPEGQEKLRYRFTDDQQVLLRAKQGLGELAPLQFAIAQW